MIVDEPDKYIHPVDLGIGMGSGKVTNNNVDPPQDEYYVFLELATPFGPLLFTLTQEQAVATANGLMQSAETLLQEIEGTSLTIARDIPDNLRPFFPKGG